MLSQARARWHAYAAPLRADEVVERLAVAALLPLAWGALQAPFLSWLWRRLPSEEYSTSLVLLLVAGAPIALRARQSLREERSGDLAGRLSRAPAAAALLLIAAAASVANEALWDLDILSGVLFGLGTYGLFGLYVSGSRWRRALPAALLLVATLPFGHHLNAYLGFPARLAVASLVQRTFEALGIASLTSQTVLHLESGAMNVDLPCSGARSAWTGLVFFLGATCLERARLGLRWALSGLGYAALLFGANVVRVAVLALLAVAGHSALAKIAHESLGVAGFALASAAAYLALRGGRAARETTAASARDGRAPLAAPRWLAPALAVALLALTAGRRPFSPVEPGPAPRVTLPAELAASPLPLTEAERGLFGRHGAHAQKLRFEGALPGALVVVHASSWRAHHPPEQCLRGSGHTLESDLPLLLPSGLPVRLVRLQGGRAALWWFQSPSGAVNDLTSRIRAELVGGERRWAMVSLLLDDLPPDAQGLDPLTAPIARAVASSFVLAQESP